MKIYNLFGFSLFILIIFSCKKELKQEILSEAEKQEIDYLEKISFKNPITTIIRCDSILSNTQSESFQAKIFFYKAEAYKTITDYNNALDYFNLSLTHFYKTNNYIFQVRTLNRISWINTIQGNYVTAVNYVTQSLKIAEDNNLNNSISGCYNTFSFIYSSNNDYEKAIEYLKKNEENFSEKNSPTKISSTYNDLSVVYMKMGDMENALKYNKKVFELINNNNMTEYYGIYYNNTGYLYNQFKKNEKALEYFKKAVEINNKTGKQKSSPIRGVAKMQLQMNQHSLAENNYLTALSIDKEKNNLLGISLALNGLIKVNEIKNDYKQAIVYQKKLDSVNQQISKNKANENIKMLENQNKLKESKQQIESKIKEVKNTRIIIITLVVLFLFIVLFSIQRLKSIKLKNEKNKIVLEQKVLRSQMNPHFIFNALSAIQNSLLDNEPIKSASYLSKFAKLIRQNFDFIDKKSISLNEEIDSLKNYVFTQKMRFEDKFDCFFNVSDEIDVNITKIPPLLLQPFIENSIEHGFKNKEEKGIISINITKETPYICYEIIDNGKGYDTNIKDNKLHSFDIFVKRLKLLGKEDDKTIIVNSSENGTSIKFSLKQ